MTTKHTPKRLLALRSGYGSRNADVDIVTETGGRIASTPYAEEAAEIVRRWNLHDDMLDALKREQEWRDREAVGALDEEWDYETMVGQYRRAVIAKAEGHQ